MQFNKNYNFNKFGDFSLFVLEWDIHLSFNENIHKRIIFITNTDIAAAWSTSTNANFAENS